MHFADTHFGVETYGRLDPATGLSTRLIDFRETLCRGIDSALERGIDVALFAGDAYKSRDPSQTHQREFALCIRRLTEQGVPVVMLTGNHDVPNVRGRAHAMEIYRTLGVQDVNILHKPGVLKLDTKAGVLQVAGMPFLMKGFILAREDCAGKTAAEVREKMEEKYGEHIEALVAQLDPSLPTVLIGHFWVRDSRLSDWQKGYFHINEPQVDRALLARSDLFDYVALGHIHRHQDLNNRKKPPIVYAGSPDCIDFGERSEKKGYVYIKLEKGSADFEFVPIDGRRELIEIEVDADDDTPTETILREIERRDLRENIVRLTYRISSVRLPLVREKEIRDALAPAYMIVAVRREIIRDETARSALLTESLEPLPALELYLDERNTPGERKSELLRYALGLIDEMNRELAA